MARNSAIIVLFTLILATTASGQTCPRGALAAPYCDRDGNLVADLPADETQWIDPDTIVFSYTPVEKPAVYAKVWDGFIRHMASVTGRKAVFFPVQSYAAQYAALRSGRLHVAGVNTGGNPLAVNCAGFVPFAVMANLDGTFGYEMEIIVPIDSPVHTLEDLRGRTLAFTSATSNSGFKAPSALLKSEFGLVADQDFETVFSGKHDNSIIGVADKTYEAAAIANSVLERMIKRGVVDDSAIRSVYKSPTFPSTGFGHSHNLHPAVSDKIRQAFLTFNWEDSELEREFGEGLQFTSIQYQPDWAVIRKIDTANGVSYECEE